MWNIIVPCLGNYSSTNSNHVLFCNSYLWSGEPYLGAFGFDWNNQAPAKAIDGLSSTFILHTAPCVENDKKFIVILLWLNDFYYLMSAEGEVDGGQRLLSSEQRRYVPLRSTGKVLEGVCEMRHDLTFSTPGRAIERASTWKKLSHLCWSWCSD